MSQQPADHANAASLPRALERDVFLRIQGDCYVSEKSEERIVFGDGQCPFVAKAVVRPAMRG